MTYICHKLTHYANMDIGFGWADLGVHCRKLSIGCINFCTCSLRFFDRLEK